MAKKSYVVLKLSFINGQLAQPGTTVSYDGEPGPNLAPVGSSEAKAATEAKTDDGDKSLV